MTVNPATLAWSRLGSIDPTALTEARLQAHYAAQWLARAARSYLPPAPDDSHSALTWSAVDAALATAPLPGGVMLALDVARLWLVVVGADGAVEFIAAERKTDAELGEAVKATLADKGLDPAALSTDLPYDMPAHPLAEGGTYDYAYHAGGLAELAAYFGNFAQLLGQVADTEAGASPVRCWPHHFDIATLITLKDTGDPETSTSIGVGLSPGDETYAEPYLYVSPWPYPDAAGLPDLPGQMAWHTEGYTAAILKASQGLSGFGSGRIAAQAATTAIQACKDRLET